MEVVQVRLPLALVKEIDLRVEAGFYSSRSDMIRDIVRTKINGQLAMAKAMNGTNGMNGGAKQ